MFERVFDISTIMDRSRKVLLFLIIYCSPVRSGSDSPGRAVENFNVFNALAEAVERLP